MGNHYNCIYMYTNLITGKRYVGKAKDFNDRYKGHLKGKKQLIDKKIKEYGIENFKVEILAEDIDENKLNDYERFFIKRKRSHVSYGTGYNKTWGGDGGDTLSGMTEEQRREQSIKMSESRKGKPSPMKGKPHTEETKQKISESLKSKQYTEEAKRRMSEAMKGNKNPMYGVHRYGEDSPRARKVICIETKEVFNTIKQAQEWLGKGNILHHLKGETKSAGKHPITKQPLHWMYYEDYLKLQEEQQNNGNSDSTANVA